jgi:transcriptional regulator with GAF, ATPase, and Fis domain
MTPSAEQPPDDLLSRTFVELADILVHDFDIVTFLQMLSGRCVGLFSVAAAGVMLQDANRILQVVASSNEDAHTLELMELQNEEGPCLDAFHTSVPVQARATESGERWPLFAGQARKFGYQAFSAVPLRLRSQTIGALNLFDDKDVLLRDDELRTAQALADIATISMLNERALRESRLVAEQLQYALTSRVVLEQAKGVLAVKLDCDVAAAFGSMRDFARRNNRRLTDVARAVVAGEIQPSDVRA